MGYILTEYPSWWGLSGGPLAVPRGAPAPISRHLDRAGDWHAAGDDRLANFIRLLDVGWTLDFRSGRGLGDYLFLLAMVTACQDAIEATGSRLPEVKYSGPLADLMARCSIGFAKVSQRSACAVEFGNLSSDSIQVRAHLLTVSEWPEELAPQGSIDSRLPAWAERLEDGTAWVYGSLAMRLYRQVEQVVGRALPRLDRPLPVFHGASPRVEGQVAIVLAASEPVKDWGIGRFLACLEEIKMPVSDVIVVTGSDDRSLVAAKAIKSTSVTVMAGPDLADCVDVFGECSLVLGNDTGLTHLAAMSESVDGSNPLVCGIYGLHSPLKWSTGFPWHHGVATTASWLVSIADRDVYLDSLEPSIWGPLASIATIDAANVARYLDSVLP